MQKLSNLNYQITSYKLNKMQIDINKQEAWKILDALQSYKNDYEVSVSVIKTIKNIEKKLKKIINSD